jgi:hypothetical protein
VVGEADFGVPRDSRAPFAPLESVGRLIGEKRGDRGGFKLPADSLGEIAPNGAEGDGRALQIGTRG